MLNSNLEVYRLPQYYDIAFGFRDVSAECNFLTDLSRRHIGRAPESFLELAAGPARHTIEFAKRGARATALDLAEPMVAYAADRARAQQVEIQCVCADMSRFALSQSYDVAALLMNSAVYLADNDAVLNNLRCVADHLTDGGLYVLEMTHPRDVFNVEESTRTRWEMEQDGTSVETEWGADGDTFDPISQTRQVTVTMRYKSAHDSGVVTDCSLERCFTANELRALVTASGRFHIVEMFGSMDLAVPFTNEKASWRMVPVLQKVR